MKHTTGMIPLATGYIRQQKKSKPKRSMNAARLNMRMKKEELDRLYELERQARKEAFQYIENRCGDIYKLSFHFMEILAKYIPVAKDKPDEPNKQETQQDVSKERPEYFNTELLSLIHKACVGGTV